MTARKEMPMHPVVQLMSGLHPSAEEIAALKALKQSGKSAEFKKSFAVLEHNQRLGSLRNLKGVDPKKFNPAAYRTLTSEELNMEPSVLRRPDDVSSLIASLKTKEGVTSDCFFSLLYNGTYVYGSISGPSKPDPNNFHGIQGVSGQLGEYTIVNNPVGDTAPGSLWGNISVLLEGTLPASGGYYVLLGERVFEIEGEAAVFARNDAAGSAGVRFCMGLTIGGHVVEFKDELIRCVYAIDDDKEATFNTTRITTPRCVPLFAGNAGDVVSLGFGLDVVTWASPLGLATCSIKKFGVIANYREDTAMSVVRHA